MKASERLPEKITNQIMARYINSRSFVYHFAYVVKTQYYSLHTIEWLDETPQDILSDNQRLRAEVEALKEHNDDLRGMLAGGRHYLMGIERDEFDASDALYAFGFGRDGFEKY